MSKQITGEDIVEKLVELVSAKKLLDSIVCYIDPYSGVIEKGMLSREDINEIREYTKFDDSE